MSKEKFLLESMNRIGTLEPALSPVMVTLHGDTSCSNHSPRWPQWSRLLAIIHLYHPFPHSIRFGLCDQCNMEKVMVFYSWDYKRYYSVCFALVLSLTCSGGNSTVSSLLESLVLGGENWHLFLTVTWPCEWAWKWIVYSQSSLQRL